MNYKCPNCNSTNGTKIETYKHYWISCNECGTIIRERKKKYAFDNWLLRLIIKKTKLKFTYERTLLPVKEVIDEERKFYDYYHDTAMHGIKGTAWEKLNDTVFNNLRQHNISLKGKSVLDISGGPGFLTKELGKFAETAILTEFSQHAVDGMKKALQIDAVKFDYNSDEISEVVDGKFDIIFIIYSIGFCDDLKNFLHSLKKIMHEESIVYICYSPPTLGLMMRWQFDEYTYTRCWPVEVVTKNFAEIGMVEVIKEPEGEYRFDENWFNDGRGKFSKSLAKLHHIIGHHYLRKALKQNNFNKELIQKNVFQIFKYNNLKNNQ